MSRTWKLGIWTLVTAGALGGSTAQAATVTVGSQLTVSFSSVSINEVTTEANRTLPGEHAASPVDGTVIGWRAAGVGNFTLRIIHPTGAAFAGAGTSTPHTLTSGTVPSAEFPTSLAIHAGDLVGVDNSTSLDQIGIATTPGAKYSFWYAPQLADGGPGSAPNGGQSQELAISAVVRYCRVPNLRGMKLGTAKRVLRNANCALGRIHKTKKGKRSRIVRGQSVAPGTAIADTIPIDIRVGKPKPKKR